MLINKCIPKCVYQGMFFIESDYNLCKKIKKTSFKSKHHNWYICHGFDWDVRNRTGACLTGNTLTTRQVTDCKITNAFVIHVFVWRGGGSIFKNSCTLEMNNEPFLTDIVELILNTFTCMLYDALQVIPNGIKEHLCNNFSQMACILLFV